MNPLGEILINYIFPSGPKPKLGVLWPLLENLATSREFGNIFRNHFQELKFR